MNTMKAETRKKLRIIVPCLIVLAIIGMWFLKNGSKLSGNTVELNHPDFALEAEVYDLDQLKEHKLPMILDFGSEACIPCKEMEPIMKKLNAEFQGKAIIRFMDVWKYKDAAKPYPIQMVPSQIVYNAEGNPYQPNDISQKLKDEFSMQTKEGYDVTYSLHQGELNEEELRAILKDLGVK